MTLAEPAVHYRIIIDSPVKLNLVRCKKQYKLCATATEGIIKSFHGFCMYLILIFIVVHIAGVLLAERKESKGIVSDMINGGKA